MDKTKQTNNDFYTATYQDADEFTRRLTRGGLSEFPPAIVSCAITGGNAGKEANPNLPETIDEQVEQTYAAYEAGASIVHIHCRCKDNPAIQSKDPADYEEINQRIRAFCPDIIINNTVVGGRKRFGNSPYELTPQLLYAIPAKAEMGSVDTSAYTSTHILHKREAPLFGRDNDEISERTYGISDTEVDQVLEMMKENGIKPEFECFSMGDFHYLNRLLKKGYVDPYGGAHMVQLVMSRFATWPTPQYLTSACSVIPPGSLLSIIAPGAIHWPILTMALCMGLHVRTGMEDNIYMARGILANSNAELVQRVVRIADEVGRKVATPLEARQMLGLLTPRPY